MRIIKIALISLLGLCVILLIGVWVFLKTFDLMRYKPQVIGQLSKALNNRKVDFESAKLGISLSQGISLKLSNFFIADNPVFSQEPLLTIKDASLGIDALGYLLKKQINVPSIAVNSPSITLIRSKDGMFNIHPITKTGQDSVLPASGEATAMVIPALMINSLTLSRGTFTYIDRIFEPAINLKVQDLDATINNISLTRIFPFMLEAAVLSSTKNIQAEGKAKLDLKTNAVTITYLKAETDLSSLALDQITAAFPMVKGAALPQSLSGRLEFMLDTLTVGPQGLINLSADASLTNAAARLVGLAAAIKDIEAHAKITKDEIILDKASLAIGQGTINGQGKIADYLGKQNFDLELNIKEISLEELITQEAQAVKAQGLISGKIQLNGKGFTPEAMQSDLSGAADISLTQARLKDINVLRTVLDKISVIPGLAQKVQANLSEKYKQKLNQKDTLLSDIRLPLLIEQGRLRVRNAVLTADEFVFQGQLEAGLNGAYALEGSFLIPKELSSSMVAAEDKLQYLLNEAGEIYIPLRVTGKAGAVNFKVDGEYIAKRILVEQGTKQLFNLLEEAFGKEEPEATEQKPPQ